MTSSPEPAEHLVHLLETLPPETRQQITAWLIDSGRAHPAIAVGAHWPPPRGRDRVAGIVPPGVASLLPHGEDSQLVTIRLPAERHAQLRAWCADHGFSMAAVVRGLIERFLEDQARVMPPA